MEKEEEEEEGVTASQPSWHRTALVAAPRTASPALGSPPSSVAPLLPISPPSHARFPACLHLPAGTGLLSLLPGSWGHAWLLR